jgi:biopolymer transport protein ExbD
MLRRKRRDMGGIPTSSMSDVAFLLLVFFLSTTKFDVKKGLGINLPAASTGEATKVKLDPSKLTSWKVRSRRSFPAIRIWLCP